VNLTVQRVRLVFPLTSILSWPRRLWLLAVAEADEQRQRTTTMDCSHLESSSSLPSSPLLQRWRCYQTT